MLGPLANAIERQWPIQRIGWQFSPDMDTGPIAVILEFSGLDIVIGIDPDDDTIAIESSANSAVAARYERTQPDLEGWLVVAAWALINEQGYFDGVQLGFSPRPGPAERCWQCVAVASTFRVTRLDSTMVSPRRSRA